MTAKECLEHAWLRRKPPAPVPPPPSTPGLDMTKDNLRLFVERWSEHPNSPYLFDVSCHMISPLLTTGVQLASSHHSLRGMSPSPCGSLGSSTESIPDYDITSTSPDDNVFNHYTFDREPHIHRLSQEFQSFERRASDSSCLGRKTDMAERVNLADEIRKLSDKLFKMSNMPDFTVPCLSDTISQSTNKLRVSNSATSANQHIPLNNSSSNVETHRSLEDNGNIPWRRTKFRVTGMNRDVPLSTYKTSVINNGELTDENGTTKNTDRWSTNGTNNALGTKDLLLKLLDKWDDNQDELRTSTGRHKSISAEWTEVESLGQRTISTLNSFFQSRTTSKKTNPFLTTNGVK